MRPDFRSFRLASIVLLCAGCTPSPAADLPSATPDSLRIDAVASPATPEAQEPWLHATPERLYMSWQEAADEGGALRFATYEHDSTGWSPARTIFEGSDLMVNWADFPALVETTDGALAAHWLRRNGPRGYDYDIWVGVSGDGGSTWGEPFKLHRDGVLAEHGFVSLVPGLSSGWTAVWLDGRETVAAGTNGEDRGAMTLRAAGISSSGVLGEAQLLDSRICDCCQTDAARVGDQVVAVYRDRSPDEVRDIYAVTGNGAGWGEPVRVAEDNWQIPGCPVNGPAIAAREGRIAVSWFTLGHGAPEVRLAFSDDAGTSFGEATVIESGTAEEATIGRIDLAWVGSRLVAVWLTDIQGTAEVRYAAFDEAGIETERGVLGTTSPARSSGFPRMSASGDRAWVAWRVPGDAAHLELRTLVTPD